VGFVSATFFIKKYIKQEENKKSSRAYTRDLKTTLGRPAFFKKKAEKEAKRLLTVGLLTFVSIATWLSYSWSLIKGVVRYFP